MPPFFDDAMRLLATLESKLNALDGFAGSMPELIREIKRLNSNLEGLQRSFDKVEDIVGRLEKAQKQPVKAKLTIDGLLRLGEQ